MHQHDKGEFLVEGEPVKFTSPREALDRGIATVYQDLAVVPLIKEKTGSRMTYRITMGVRPSDQEWKRTLNQVIKENQKEINQILISYGVPLLDEQDRPITQ